MLKANWILVFFKFYSTDAPRTSPRTPPPSMTGLKNTTERQEDGGGKDTFFVLTVFTFVKIHTTSETFQFLTLIVPIYGKFNNTNTRSPYFSYCMTCRICYVHIFMKRNQRIPSSNCEMPVVARPQDQKFPVDVNAFRLLLWIKLYVESLC